MGPSMDRLIEILGESSSRLVHCTRTSEATQATSSDRFHGSEWLMMLIKKDWLRCHLREHAVDVETECDVTRREHPEGCDCR